MTIQTSGGVESRRQCNHISNFPSRSQPNRAGFFRFQALIPAWMHGLIAHRPGLGCGHAKGAVTFPGLRGCLDGDGPVKLG
jgi:hypothetical protein